MCVTAQRHYAADTRAPAAARMFGHAAVVAALEPGGWALADDAALVISELVTDAVERGARRIDLEITMHFDRVAIDLVHDHADGDTPPPSVRAGTTEPGLRRQIVESLVSGAQTRAVPGRRLSTRVELAADPAYARGLACTLRPPG